MHTLETTSSTSRWLLAAHTLAALSSLCFTFAALAKFVEQGTIPDKPLQQPSTEAPATTSMRARDYFS